MGVTEADELREQYADLLRLYRALNVTAHRHLAELREERARADLLETQLAATYSEVRDAVYEVLRHPSTSFCTPDVLTARVMEALAATLHMWRVHGQPKGPLG